MRFLTKEWYQAMQDSDFHAMLEVDSRAAVFSDIYFKGLYRSELQKWLDVRAEVCDVLSIPFDEDIERKSFDKGYRINKKKIIERMPESILNQVADVRVLALNRCTEDIYSLIASFSESNRHFVEKTMSECVSFMRSQFMDPADLLLERFAFHDNIIKSSRKSGNDWVIDFGECENEHSQVRYIRFKNANIVTQEKRLHGAWWLYEELYKTQHGYEVHVLLDKKGLVEFVLTCDDIVLE